MNVPSANRLYSLDLFRGITMLLLLAEAAQVYHSLTNYFPTGTGQAIIEQFHHHPWNGLRFWDLIQPFFMFIVGVAMPFSQRSRLKNGHTSSENLRHILRRCLLLFLFGTGLHCVYSGEIVWELWNVLTQLSFTILVTYLLLGTSLRGMLLASIGFLLLAELGYRAYDFSTPFIKDQNFGSWVDLLLMGKIDDGGGWVTINCIPTAAHTIWGAMCGKLLLSDRQPTKILTTFLGAGFIALLLGYGLDLLGITPIIKRIATSSFALASGGWALLTLAFLYWWVDVKGHQKWTLPFAIIGMNSIFIYLFGETIGVQWLGGFVKSFSYDPLRFLGISEAGLPVVNSFLTLGVMWWLCVFLYRKKLFFKV